MPLTRFGATSILLISVLLAGGALASPTGKVLHNFVPYRHGLTPQGNMVADPQGNLYGTAAYGGTSTCDFGGGCGVVFRLVHDLKGNWKQEVLHNFNGNDGMWPANVVSDVAGNVYATTAAAGTYGGGTVVELTPSSKGYWSETVLHEFSGSDGYGPGGLVLGPTGTIYGTTYNGGQSGCGVVFQLTQGANGTWTESTVYAFAGQPDGCNPDGTPIVDEKGDLFGVTRNGGGGVGAVYELTPSGQGEWQEKVIYGFYGRQYYGEFPNSLVLGSGGKLYGTASGGGGTLDGTVFELAPQGSGQWSITLLYTFSGANGAIPQSITLDQSGDIYGVTLYGGVAGKGCTSEGCGTVFKMTRTGGGNWTETVIHRFDNLPGGVYGAPGLVFDSSGGMFGATLAGGSQACPPYTFPGCGTLYKLTRSGGGRWCHRVLFAFPGTDGADPGAPLVADSAGNLYGTTEIGGAYSVGTVFELTRTKRGCWHRRVLYSFKGAPDGASPEANLIFDGAGALYGTTLIGGTGSCNGGGFQNSCGTVFKLTPQPGGNWTETVLYSFSGGDDGGWPMAGLVLDSFGNLYGTTSSYGTTNCGQGNQVGCGTLFELSPRSEGRWTETTLHDFTGQPNDGGFPEGGLVLDGSGNLYGTTTIGGSSDQGSVFELSPGSNGQWTEALLYNFTGDSAGAYPLGNLIFDRFGNLYGVALIGGAGQCYGRGCGAVFELSPGQGGSWTVITIYDFTGYPNDGYYPVGGLTVDQAGNLYGATQYGGTFSEACGLGCGTVFELTPAGRGSWNENVLYRFNSNDGSNPTGVIRDKAGNLYGATYYGGPAWDGVVFEVRP